VIDEPLGDLGNVSRVFVAQSADQIGRATEQMLNADENIPLSVVV
jgi:hypothetical protein